MHDITHLSDVEVRTRARDYGNAIEFRLIGLTEEGEPESLDARVFRDTAQEMVRKLEQAAGTQHLVVGEAVTETKFGWVPQKMHRAPQKLCSTVGDLINELRRLPPTMPTTGFNQGDGYVILIYNINDAPFVCVEWASESDLAANKDEELDPPVEDEDDEEGLDYS